MYRNCEKTIHILSRIADNALRNALPHTHTRYTGKKLDSERVTCHPPDFYCGISLANFFIYFIIRNARQGFTLETEEFPSNKKPYLTLVGQHAMANREKITVTSIEVEDTGSSYKVLMSGKDKFGMERWGAHEEFKSKTGQGYTRLCKSSLEVPEEFIQSA